MVHDFAKPMGTQNSAWLIMCLFQGAGAHRFCYPVERSGAQLLRGRGDSHRLPAPPTAIPEIQEKQWLLSRITLDPVHFANGNQCQLISPATFAQVFYVLGPAVCLETFEILGMGLKIIDHACAETLMIVIWLPTGSTNGDELTVTIRRSPLATQTLYCQPWKRLLRNWGYLVAPTTVERWRWSASNHSDDADYDWTAHLNHIS